MQISKDWCSNAAKREEGHEVSAGTPLNELTWDEWKARFEDHHEKLFTQPDGTVNGYGPRPVMETTGEDAWRESYEEGMCPEDALAEDIQYWDCDD